MGCVCSSLLMLFELNGDVIEDIIDHTISSNVLIQRAIEQSIKAGVFRTMFESSEKAMGEKTFIAAIDQSTKSMMYANVEEALQQAGATTVSAEQISRNVEDEIAARRGAEAYLASGEEIHLLPSPSTSEVSNKKRDTKEYLAVKKLRKQYSPAQIRENAKKYASELGMNQRTLLGHLDRLEGKMRTQKGA